MLKKDPSSEHTLLVNRCCWEPHQVASCYLCFVVHTQGTTYFQYINFRLLANPILFASSNTIVYTSHNSPYCAISKIHIFAHIAFFLYYSMLLRPTANVKTFLMLSGVLKPNRLLILSFINIQCHHSEQAQIMVAYTSRRPCFCLLLYPRISYAPYQTTLFLDKNTILPGFFALQIQPK